jgi:hypothetical protein
MCVDDVATKAGVARFTLLPFIPYDQDGGNVRVSFSR